MRFTRRVLSVLTALTTTAGITVAVAHTAQAASLPTHVFAPYFEAWTGDSPAALAQQSGSKYLTMAFLQAATKGSCTAYWNGDTGMPISSSTFGSDFTTIRANGGDGIPSFRGGTPRNNGTQNARNRTHRQPNPAGVWKTNTTHNTREERPGTQEN